LFTKEESLRGIRVKKIRRTVTPMIIELRRKGLAPKTNVFKNTFRKLKRFWNRRNNVNRIAQQRYDSQRVLA